MFAGAAGATELAIGLTGAMGGIMGDTIIGTGMSIHGSTSWGSGKLY